MYRASEKTGGEKPIDLVRATKPIIIVDEPQSVDGGIDGRGKKALDRMDPLCTLRYSATHAEKHNMVYRLDAVDAYEQKLVKQIEVAAATVQGANNKAYVKLLSVSSKRGVISAVIEVDRENSAGVVRRDSIPVQDGFDLEQETGRALYANVRIGEIRTAKGDQFMELKVPGSEVFLRPGDAWGDVDATAIQREMIRRTIKEHLDKEKRLRPLGVKVLSLFFIDAVDKYRQYDAEGNPVKGEYAVIFEEEYKRWARHPDYQSLFGEIDLNTAADEVHNGYFSIDKKKVGGKSVEVFKDTSGETKADDDTYNLIMRDKEKLLGFESPLKFIFSHSALKEGWDNPNVFQICNFSTRETERWRRQTIGRGLRLCVNQERPAPARLRGQYADGDCDRELSAVRRKSAKGYRARYRHPVRRGAGSRVRRHCREAGERRAGALGLRSVENPVEPPQGAGLHQRQGQSAGRLESGLEGRNAGAARRI
jgi:type III restriction enzyme